MANQTPFAFRMIGSLTLSVVYFAFAVGMWAFQQESIAINADVISTPTIESSETATSASNGTTAALAATNLTPKTTNPVALVSTGGSLPVNLAVAILLSFMTIFFFVRHHVGE